MFQKLFEHLQGLTQPNCRSYILAKLGSMKTERYAGPSKMQKFLDIYYQPTEEPKIGDIVSWYYSGKKKGPSHVGLVSRVENEWIIESRMGNKGPVKELREEEIIPWFGANPSNYQIIYYTRKS